MLLTFPQYLDKVYAFCFEKLLPEKLERVKSGLIAADPNYDYCFLNTQHIVSLEHLRSSIYRALDNRADGTMKAKTLNTEIIFNLLPVNNIMDALKRFGVDPACPNIIAIKVVSSDDEDGDEVSEHSIESKLNELLQSDPIDLTDDFLLSKVDLQKVKKLYKLNDAQVPLDHDTLTRLVICSCQLRGL